MNVQTREHGRFYTGQDGQPRFAGSASGVYLVDTIRNELSSPESRVDGLLEAFISRLEIPATTATDTTLFLPTLFKPRDLTDIQELRIRFDAYFRYWHPLFPFLDGKSVHATLGRVLSEAASVPVGQRSSSYILDQCPPQLALVRTIWLRAAFTIGGLGRVPDSNIPTIEAPSQALNMAYLVLDANESSLVDDVSAVQALFALQLTMYCLRWFRPAARMSAMTIKLALEAGLHRCPSRYPFTFQSDSVRDLRKRIFYSVYALDRILSADFGFPITLRHVDIDVCLPGAPELHGISRSAHEPHGSSSALHTSMVGKRKRTEDESNMTPTDVHPSNPDEIQDRSRHPSESPNRYPDESRGLVVKDRLAAARAMAQLAGLIGRMLETFNQSRRWRVADPEDALRMRTDLDEWWFDLERDMNDSSSLAIQASPHRALFKCLYHQQVIRIHRHGLSLPKASIIHRHALQSIVLAARAISSTLEHELSAQSPGLVWPGYVDLLFDVALAFLYEAKINGTSSQPGTLRELKATSHTLSGLASIWSSIAPIKTIVTNLVNRSEEPQIQTHTRESSFNDISLDWLTQFNLEANPLDFNVGQSEEMVHDLTSTGISQSFRPMPF